MTNTRSIAQVRKDERAAAKWEASLPTMAELNARLEAKIAARAAKI